MIHDQNSQQMHLMNACWSSTVLMQISVCVSVEGGGGGGGGEPRGVGEREGWREQLGVGEREGGSTGGVGVGGSGGGGGGGGKRESVLQQNAFMLIMFFAPDQSEVFYRSIYFYLWFDIKPLLHHYGKSEKSVSTLWSILFSKMASMFGGREEMENNLFYFKNASW